MTGVSDLHYKDLGNSNIAILCHMKKYFTSTEKNHYQYLTNDLNSNPVSYPSNKQLKRLKR